MSLLDKLNQIDRIHSLIQRRATGRPCDLAYRLSISERAVYDCIELMKELDAPIYYCRNSNSYCYDNEVNFSFRFIIKNSALNQVKGGSCWRSNYDLDNCTFFAV